MTGFAMESYLLAATTASAIALETGAVTYEEGRSSGSSRSQASSPETAPPLGAVLNMAEIRRRRASAPAV